MAEGTVRGQFVWHELMTSDPKSAAAFYGKVVGWKPKPWNENPSYLLLQTGGRPMAGAFPSPEEAKGSPSQWFCYISTPDVDAASVDVGELGGKVLRQPTDIPTIGRFAIVQDPQGAVFCLFTPSGNPPAPAKPGLADFSWHELITSDWEAGFAFYQKMFGWEKTDSMDMGAMGIYQMYGRDGKTFGGMFNAPPGRGDRPAWLAYVLVPDARRAAEIVKKAGGKIINGPMQIPGGGWIAQGLDPQGVMFAVHSAAAAPKAATTTAKKKGTKKTAGASKKKTTKAAKGKRTAKAARKTTAKKTSKRRPAKRQTAKRQTKKGRRRR